MPCAWSIVYKHMHINFKVSSAYSLILSHAHGPPIQARTWFIGRAKTWSPHCLCWTRMSEESRCSLEKETLGPWQAKTVPWLPQLWKTFPILPIILYIMYYCVWYRYKQKLGALQVTSRVLQLETRVYLKAAIDVCNASLFPFKSLAPCIPSLTELFSVYNADRKGQSCWKSRRPTGTVEWNAHRPWEAQENTHVKPTWQG